MLKKFLCFWEAELCSKLGSVRVASAEILRPRDCLWTRRGAANAASMFLGENGAATQNRTVGLTLTKGALYP